MILADVHTTQLDDPTTGLDGLNCTCALGAAGIKWHYRNKRPTPDPVFVWPPTGGIVRALCRSDNGIPDTEGGTTLFQVQDAIWRGWQVPMVVYTDQPFDLGWQKAQDPDNLVIWQFQYVVLHGTPLECSATFRGPHAAGTANAKQQRADWTDPLADGRRPGIPDGVQRISRVLLRDGCGQLVVKPATGQKRGTGRANFAVIGARPEQPVTDDADLMFNVGPSTTYRDAVLKAGTVLYRDAALTVRQSAVQAETPLGFLGSTAAAHVVVNSGSSNYVRRADVARIVVNERTFE